MSESESHEVCYVSQHRHTCDGAHGPPATVEHRWSDGRLDQLPSACPEHGIGVLDAFTSAEVLNWFREEGEIALDIDREYWSLQIRPDVFCVISGDPKELDGTRYWGSETTVSITAVLGSAEDAREHLPHES